MRWNRHIARTATWHLNSFPNIRRKLLPRPPPLLFLKISGTNDNRIWQVDTWDTANPDAPAAQYNTIQNGLSSVSDAQCSPDGKHIALNALMGGIAVYDMSTLKQISFFSDSHGVGDALIVAWSADSKRIASITTNGPINVWDAMTGNSVYNFTNPDADYQQGVILWSADSKHIASVGAKDIIQIWDADTGKILFSYSLKDSSSAISWSPDGSMIAIGYESGVVEVIKAA